jgi:hypothetical protein
LSRYSRPCIAKLVWSRTRTYKFKRRISRIVEAVADGLPAPCLTQPEEAT